MQDLQTVQDSITNPRLIAPPQRKEWATIFIAIAWNIWLIRNSMVFENISNPTRIMEENFGPTGAEELIKGKPSQTGYKLIEQNKPGS
jgi:hypothetical protein